MNYCTKLRSLLLPAARSVQAERGPVAVCVRQVSVRRLRLGVHTGVRGLYKRGDPLHLDVRTPVATGVHQSGPDDTSLAKRGRGSEGTLARLLARTQAAGQRREAAGPSSLWVVPA